MSDELHEELVFVGYTNGYQILYGAESEGGEGSFYSDTENNCHIPLYMLKSHAHRLQTTTDMNVTLDKLKKAQSKCA
jgi:hypothetical protein